MAVAAAIALLDDPEQRADLEARVAAAEALGASDPRLARPPLAIPAGAFWRGSEAPAGAYNEWPGRRLWLPAFEIDPYPVTVVQFGRFIAEGAYRRRELWSAEGWAFVQAGHVLPRFWDEPEWAAYVTPNRPIVGASFHEAEAYARWSGRRLPSEAEWERAARGEDGRAYPWGEDFDPARCHHRGGRPGMGSRSGSATRGSAVPDAQSRRPVGPHRGTLPVGCFPAGRSPAGAFDMAGNVWEWCQDFFDEGYYATAPERDPRGPETGALRVARGGGWNAMPGQLRCANRNAWPPEARYSNLGFRLAGPPR